LLGILSFVVVVDNDYARFSQEVLESICIELGGVGGLALSMVGRAYVGAFVNFFLI
jgi:hypothetical protein